MRTYTRLSATQVDKLALARQPGMFADGEAFMDCSTRDRSLVPPLNRLISTHWRTP